MATMKKNGEITLTLEELRDLLGTATATATAKQAAKPAAKKAAKPAAKKYDASLDAPRVKAMVTRATTAMEKAGYPVKARPQGKWWWLYSTTGDGRAAGFKAVKLAKGWTYSPRRGAWYRDFS